MAAGSRGWATCRRTCPPARPARIRHPPSWPGRVAPPTAPPSLLPAFEARAQVPAACAEASGLPASTWPPPAPLSGPPQMAAALPTGCGPGRRQNKPALFRCQGPAGPGPRWGGAGPVLSGQAAGQRSHLDRTGLGLPLFREEHPRAGQGPGCGDPCGSPCLPHLVFLPLRGLHKRSALLLFFYLR